MKVITGLYSLQVGEIRLDELPITDMNHEWYCQLFSAVFSNFFLFDSLLGLHASDLDAQAHRYLVEIELDAKVQITAGAFSMTSLSHDQWKRFPPCPALCEQYWISN